MTEEFSTKLRKVMAEKYGVGPDEFDQLIEGYQHLYILGLFNANPNPELTAAVIIDARDAVRKLPLH